MPDAPRALVAGLAQYPRDGECGASDMAFENAVAACVEIKLRAPHAIDATTCVELTG